MKTVIDITHTPFSSYGGMVAVSKTDGRDELVIHDARQRFFRNAAFFMY